MPQARCWTETADNVIKTMRADGQTWAAIGYSLGLSRNTVIERGRRLCAHAPKRSLVAASKPVSDDPNRAPLPAGHPLTWGLLTDADFPNFCADGGKHFLFRNRIGCGAPRVAGRLEKVTPASFANVPRPRPASNTKGYKE